MERFLDDFAQPDFIAVNEPFFDRYVDLRVHGYSSRTSFIKVFGLDHYPDPQQGYRRTSDIEETDWYRAAFEARLKTVTVAELWHTKSSIHELLAIVREDATRDSTRLNAIKELNVLVGITVVDENGKTKAGRTLADFYAENGKSKVPGKPAPADPSATAH